MALKTETREIGGLAITCSQFPSMATYRLFARLGRITGPAIGALKGIDITADEEDISAFAPALAELIAHLADDEDLVIALLKQTSCEINGKRAYLTSEDRINAAFEGNFAALLGALKLSLEVNFSSFFAEGLALFAKRAQKEDSSDSPTE